MTIAILLAALAIVPLDSVLRDSVDVIEVNSYFDGEGRLTFVQNIFIDWQRGSEVVVAWRLVKDDSHRPTHDAKGGYVVTWWDSGVLRQVRSKYLRETYLQYDPETAARECYPVEWRRGLRK